MIDDFPSTRRVDNKPGDEDPDLDLLAAGSRGVGRIKLAEVEMDARETYSAIGLNSSSCIGSQEDVVRISLI